MDSIGIIIVIALMAAFESVWWMLYRSWGPFPTRTKLPSSLPLLAAPDNNAGACRVLAQSNKILAIKGIRELTGMELQAARDYIETLPNAPTLALLSVAAWVPSNTPQMAAEARRLLEDGNRIHAIKRVRELTGMSPKEATAYVEAL